MGRFGPWTTPRLALATLGGAVGLALLVAASTSGAAFGPFNHGWDGTADLRGTVQESDNGTIVRNASAYPTRQTNDTLAIILSPDSTYGPAEVSRLRQFLRRGGTLVLADDFGTASNRLLEALGADVRFDGRLIRDDRHHYRSPAMPYADGHDDRPLLDDVDRLTLNYGTAVDPGNATVLANTTQYAYLDGNRNGRLDADERMASYPVVVEERVGDGRILAVGDPSLFVNAMADRPGNRRFVRGLVERHVAVLLDYSHVEGLPPLSVAILTVRNSPPLQALMAALVAVVGWSWTNWLPGMTRLRRTFADRQPAVDRSPSPPVDDLVAAIERHHPEWDDEAVRRVVKATMRTGDEAFDDE